MRNAVTTTSILGLATLGLLAGCPDRTISEVNPQQGRVEYKDIPVTVNRDIDILFIIDDSPSMLDKQTNLKTNFPNFINVLNTIEGGLPNVHLGVVTLGPRHEGRRGRDRRVRRSAPVRGSCSGNGKAGNLQTNGCALVQRHVHQRHRRTPTARVRRTTPARSRPRSRRSPASAPRVAASSSTSRRRSARVNNNPANAGFLRPNAYLALIFIQDEDDCSFAKSTLLGSDTGTLGPLQSFRCNRFGHVCTTGGADSNAMNKVGTKGGCTSNENSHVPDEGRRLRHVLQGPQERPGERHRRRHHGRRPTPYEVELRTPPGGGTAIPAVAHSCTYTAARNGPEVADPSIRLKQFLDRFPNRSTFTTICQQDLSGALTQIAQLLRTVIGSPCIEGNLADVDPNTAGNQYDCSVSDVTNYGKANQTENVLPQCNNATAPASSTNKPCWSIQTDTMNCMSGDQADAQDRAQRSAAARHARHLVLRDRSVSSSLSQSTTARTSAPFSFSAFRRRVCFGDGCAARATRTGMRFTRCEALSLRSAARWLSRSSRSRRCIRSQGTVETKDLPAVPNRDVDILFLDRQTRARWKRSRRRCGRTSRGSCRCSRRSRAGCRTSTSASSTSNMGQHATRRRRHRRRSVPRCAKQGDDGVMRTAPHDQRPLHRRRREPAAARNRNYTGTLADAFSAIANVGIEGCGIEQHLAAIEAHAREPGERRLSAPGREARGDRDRRRGRLLAREEVAVRGLERRHRRELPLHAARASSATDDPDLTIPGERTNCHPKDRLARISTRSTATSTTCKASRRPPTRT